MAAIASTVAGENLTNRQRILAIFKASSGNLLEWSSFYFFPYYMIYFAPSFFPHGNSTVQLLRGALLFAVSFIGRPIGGWFYGRLADRQGRRYALIHSGFAMLLGSLLLATAPTYATVGYLAPLVLFVARLLQGFSIGGDYGTSATYVSEIALKNQRGLLGSLQYTTLLGGQLIALLTMIILESLLTKLQLFNWGWRIPFILGAVAALLSVHLRLSLEENTTSRKQSKQAGSLQKLLQYKQELITVFFTTAAGSACFYTFTVYMQKYLVNSLHVPSNIANTILACALVICMCLQPIFGALSDRIGRFIPMVIFSGMMTVLIMPIMYWLSHTESIYVAFCLIIAALTILSFYTSISGLIKAEIFPAEVRALGVGFSYALANAIFGGSSEYIALWTKANGMEFSFYGYITLLCLLSLVVCIRYLRNSLKMNYLEKKE